MLKPDEVFAKCAWRLMPLITLLYFFNLTDRVNVSFASLTMNRDLGLGPAVYGLGAGVFFLGYALFQIPANAILERLGARRWVFLILFLWGFLSAANAAVRGPYSFYAVRVLLGVVESGFYPGMILYLTYWFTRSYRGHLVAIFMAALPAANIVGGPLSSLILGIDGDLGLRGWQWLFLLEGAPAVLLSFIVLAILPDNPGKAVWLTPDEKALIAAELSAEDTAPHRDFWVALADRKIFGLAMACFGYSIGLYGVGLWLPQIVKGMGVSNLANGFVVAIPYIAGAVAMIWWGWRSDRTGERIWHVAGPAMLITASLLMASVSHANPIIFLALSLALIGTFCLQAPFWVLPSMFLGGGAVASGIALINSVGTGAGGFVGPYVLGLVRQSAGGFGPGMAILAAGPALTVAIVLFLGRSVSRLYGVRIDRKTQ